MNFLLGVVAAVIIMVLTGGAGWLFALIALAAGFSAESADSVVMNPQVPDNTAYAVGCGEILLLLAGIAFVVLVIL